MFALLWQIIPWALAAAGAIAVVVLRRKHRLDQADAALVLQRVLQAVESASDAIGIGDFEGNSTYHNRAHLALFGYTVAELNAVPGSGVLFANKETAREIIASIREGQSWAGETEVLTKAGKKIPAYVRADIIRDPQGTPVGIFGIFRDITRERQLAEEAARANKLDSLGMMAGGIAHDFNNLLTVILGEVSLAELQPGISPSLGVSLGEIRKVARRAQDLTSRLRSFAKGETPAMAPLALPRLVMEATERAARGSPVRPRFDFAPDLPLVMADETQVLQVVHNLALNAVQAMPEGGALIVTAVRLGRERVRELGLAAGNWVGLSFADTGGGILAENLTHLFEPFFTTKASGTGLGLATSYNIVKKHGGTIKVESTKGFGTTFQVILPAAPAAAATAGGSAPAAALRG
jgi:PAS domain S-box-containing protein